MIREWPSIIKYYEELSEGCSHPYPEIKDTLIHLEKRGYVAAGLKGSTSMFDLVLGQANNIYENPHLRITPHAGWPHEKNPIGFKIEYSSNRNTHIFKDYPWYIIAERGTLTPRVERLLVKRLRWFKGSLNSWHEKIEEREFHGKPQGKWVIEGWYEDEKEDFYIEETEWNKRSQEGWEKNGGIISLDIVDDYFSWNVTTPHWYLHDDGKWRKSLCAWFELNCTKRMGGEFSSREAAEEALRNVTHRPKRFENYVEHLRNAAPPIWCRANV